MSQIKITSKWLHQAVSNLSQSGVTKYLTLKLVKLYSLHDFVVKYVSLHQINDRDSGSFLQQLFAWETTQPFAGRFQFNMTIEKHQNLFRYNTVNDIHLVKYVIEMKFMRLFTECYRPSWLSYLEITFSADFLHH